MALVCGVGINDYTVGSRATWTEYDRRVYDLWLGMLRRCYSSNSLKRQPTYTGCSVDPSWYRLSSFVKYLPSIPGYTYWLNNPGKRIALDKDTLVPGNRVYGPGLVQFISISVNCTESNTRNPANNTRNASLSHMRAVIGIDPDGNTYTWDSIKSASIATGFSKSGISNNINRGNKCHGWVFKYV